MAKERLRDRIKITVTLIFLAEKHKYLLEWIKSEADEREMSISSFCISMLKWCKKELEGVDDE